MPEVYLLPGNLMPDVDKNLLAFASVMMTMSCSLAFNRGNDTIDKLPDIKKFSGIEQDYKDEIKKNRSLYINDIGGFTPGGKEYEIRIRKGNTPTLEML